MLDFTNSNIVITGGHGALGSAVVEYFTQAGARCHVPKNIDCANENQVTQFFADLPPIQASVHLVGGFAMSPLLQTSAADFDAMYRVNALTAFLCCREAVRKFGKSGGRIVNVASKVAAQPVGGMLAYSAAKSAVAALTQGLAEEVKSQGILVNAVLPSIMDTPQNRAAMPKADFSRWPKVSDVAQTIGFLCHAKNTLTSGALVPVYGQS